MTLYAGFFGIFGIFNKAPITNVSENTYNIQNLPILESVPNPNGVSSGGGDVVIVDDSALFAEAGTASASDITPSEFAKKSNKISTYVVQEGDTISQIAEMFGVSTNTIRWGNDIDADGVIQPGQRLVILPITGIKHTIQKGDTIKSIAKEYDGDANEILRYNEMLSSDELVVGEEIVIPGGRSHDQTPAKSSSGSTSSTSYAKAPTPSGYYTNPVPGSVRTQGIHGFNAVDLAAPVGTPIYAAASGEVIVSKSSGWNGGYALYIVIKHDNGSQTLYAHNSKNVVYVGQYVEKGELIGYVGSTGNSTGPHVHFEVRGATNPMAY